jgi:hypothetical protein
MATLVEAQTLLSVELGCSIEVVAKNQVHITITTITILFIVLQN